MKKVFLLILLTTTLLSATAQETKRIELLNPLQFEQAIDDKNVQLIDIRTPLEYAEEHIEGSVNIDFLSQESFKTAVQKLDKTKALYIYCRSGARSEKAAKQLQGLGFELIYDLRGGFLNWNK
tara:strand:- start:188466 stop:188834 length:369 start_codon:yes stop_codon:yes gene_type:complete